MLKFKINSWLDASIADYEKIMEIGTDKTLSEAEKDIALIAYLAEVPEEEIWDLPIEEVRKLREKLLWISTNYNYPKKEFNYKKIKIGDTTCKILTDLQKMTYAQFVDFQTYIKDMEHKRAEILSVFFIPEGHKYGDGYDIVALQKEIREKVGITVFSQCFFFFLKKYTASLNHTAIYLASMLKVRSWMMKKSNPLKAKYKELARIIRGIPKLMYG